MLGMDVRQHLMAFERERIRAHGGIPCREAARLEDGERAVVVGLAMRLRFPPTASGKRVVFFDLEDETGLLNVTVFDETYRRDGHTIITCPFVTLRGYAQDREGHTAFVATRVYPYQMAVDPDGLAQRAGAVHAEDFLTARRR
jgi:error-prone DNA polymerase